MTFYLNYKDTSYWGPIYWNILHNLAKKVDENNDEIKNKFLHIIKNFKSLIPCDDCSSTYLKTLDYAFELILLNNVLTKYYFQKLIYYLHLCVAVKKKEEKNLEIFIDLIRKKVSLEKAYKQLYPNDTFIGFEVVLTQKPLNKKDFETYYEKHMLNLGDYNIYQELLQLINFL
jgi:hypothetical protein